MTSSSSLTLLRLIVVAIIASLVQSKGLRDSQQVELQVTTTPALPKVLVKNDGTDKFAVLYTQDGEPAPQPAGLYQVVSLKEGASPFTGVDAVYTHKYIPNVWLFERKDYSDDNPDDAKDWSYSTEKGDDHVKLELTMGMGGLKSRLTAKKTTTDTMIQTPPTMSVVALNDCARFSQFLMWLLKDNGKEGSIQTSVAKASTKTPLTLTKLKALKFGTNQADLPSVGDSFQLKYASGGHHGLTVVSVGEGYFVCLEAHASKHLKRPYFHVYTSMTDFVNKNFKNAASGDKGLLITPALGPGVLDTACKATEAKKHHPNLEELMKDTAKTDKDVFDQLTAFSMKYLPSLEEA